MHTLYKKNKSKEKEKTKQNKTNKNKNKNNNKNKSKTKAKTKQIIKKINKWKTQKHQAQAVQVPVNRDGQLAWLANDHNIYV